MGGQVDHTMMASSGGYDDYSARGDLKPLPDTLSVDQIKKSLTERLLSIQCGHGHIYNSKSKDLCWGQFHIFLSYIQILPPIPALETTTKMYHSTTLTALL